MAGDSHAPGQTGATPEQLNRKAPALAAAAEDEAEAEEPESVEELEREIADLERQLADLDRRMLDHLHGTATGLTDNTASILAALRPYASLEDAVVSDTSATKDEEELKKLKILKSKIEDSAANLPKVLEKMNKTADRLEEAHGLNVNIDPVFRRK